MAEQRQQIEIHGQLHQSFLTAVAEAHKHLEGLSKAAAVAISGSLPGGGGGGVPGGLPPLRPGPGLVDVGARPMPVGPVLPPAKSPGGASSHLTPGAPPSPTGGGAAGAPPPGGGGMGAGPKMTQQDLFSFAVLWESVRRPIEALMHPGQAAQQAKQANTTGLVYPTDVPGTLAGLSRERGIARTILERADISGGTIPLPQVAYARQHAYHLGQLASRGTQHVATYEALPPIKIPGLENAAAGRSGFGSYGPPLVEAFATAQELAAQGVISSGFRSMQDIPSGFSLQTKRSLDAATASLDVLKSLTRLSGTPGFATPERQKTTMEAIRKSREALAQFLPQGQHEIQQYVREISTLAGTMKIPLSLSSIPSVAEITQSLRSIERLPPTESKEEAQNRKTLFTQLTTLYKSTGAYTSRSEAAKVLVEAQTVLAAAPVVGMTPEQYKRLKDLSVRAGSLREEILSKQPTLAHGAIASLASGVLGPAGAVLPVGQFMSGYLSAGGVGGGSVALGLGGAAAGAALLAGAFAEGMPFAQNTTSLAMSLRTSPREMYNVLANGVGSFATPGEAVSTLGAIAGSGVRPRNASIMGVFFPDVQSAATFARTMGISPEAGGQLLAQGVLAGVGMLQHPQAFFDAVRHASLRSGMTGAGFAQGYGDLIGTLQQQVVPTGAAGLLAGATAFGNQMGIAPLQGTRAVQTLLGINQNFVSGQAFSGLPGPISLGLMTALRGHAPHSLWGMMAATERGISSPQQLTRVFSQLYGEYQKGGADLYGIVGNQIFPGGAAGALGTALEHMFRSETPAQVQHNLSLLQHGKSIMMGGHPVTSAQLFGKYELSPGAQAVQLLTDIKAILTNLYQAMTPIVSVLATVLKVPAEILKPFSWGLGTLMPPIPMTGGINAASTQRIKRETTPVNQHGGFSFDIGWPFNTQFTIGGSGQPAHGSAPTPASGTAGSSAISSGLHFIKHLATHALGGTAHAATLPTQGDFLAKMTPIADKVSRATGMPVKFLLAQWAHESGWGKSWAAIANLNFGGIKPTAQYGPGYDPKYAGFHNLNQFAQADIAALTQGRYNTARSYAMADPTDLAGIGSRLQQEGYAGRKSTSYGQEVAAAGQSVHTALQTDTGTIHIHITHTPKRASASVSRPHFASRS